MARRRTEHGPLDTVSVVVMGVSGVGKSTVAETLVTATGWPFAEGDDLHSEAHRAKMAAGVPLDEADRRPWLRRLAAWIGEQEAQGLCAVLTCSALRRAYRDVLRDGHPSVYFLHLVAPQDVLTTRIAGRHDHYMPAALLGSQLDTLEPLAADERGSTVDSTADPATTVANVLAALAARNPAQEAAPRPAADHEG